MRTLTAMADARGQSPLQQVLVHHRATMTMRHGRPVAARFGSAASEATVCVKSVGIADRFDRATLTLGGEPRGIREALAALGMLRTPAWASALTTREAVARCERADAAQCIEALSIFEDIVVHDATGAYAAIALIGPRAKALLDACGFDVSSPSPIVLREGAAAYELLVRAEHGPELWEHLLEIGGPFGIACVGLEALEHLAAAHRL